jgi:hypothetical protein
MLPRIYRNETDSTPHDYYNTHVANTTPEFMSKRWTTAALSRKDLDDTVSTRAHHQPSIAAPTDVTHALAPHSAM